MPHAPSRAILKGHAQGPILATHEPISFWGGIDPASGVVIDVHHPLHGQSVAGTILMMPSTRGSCTGSGVLLDLALNAKAPAALVFSQAEDVATLGALIAGEMFERPVPVLRLSPRDWAALAAASSARLTPQTVTAEGLNLTLAADPPAPLTLTARDEAILAGAEGVAAQLALRVICAMAQNQGARDLVDVVQGHIDGCIYASPANLTFAEKMVELGAKVVIPTTMNAISVDHENWQAQGVAPKFGGPAARLADAYVRMGCQNTFTCSPYLLESAPKTGEMIAWAESNAVIYANSVIGARTTKHPDFLDLFIAMTGRAPRAGVYLDENRTAQKVLRVTQPEGADDAFWPLIGYLAGQASPDTIPVIEGLEEAGATPEGLKAMCAAFGTSSAAPMLHVAGVTPEAHLRAPHVPTAEITVEITRADMVAAWRKLNAGPEVVGLVAIGSPHASYEECARFAAALAGRNVVIPTLITAGRNVITAARASGLFAQLDALGVQILPDLCWCSISEPVFPPETKALITNSGKYAHYGPGLSGRMVRFAGLAACADAAASGVAAHNLPDWLA